MRSLKTNPSARLIRPLHRTLQRPRSRRHSQHTPASSIKSTIPLRSPRVKHLHSIDLSPVESCNLLPHLVRPRISSRSHHHAYRSIARPLEIAFTDPAFNRRLQSLHQIALQPHQNRLRLRIPEPAIKLQHHRTSRRHHQPAVQHAFIFRALRFHALNHGLRNVMHQPVPHRVVHNIGSRVSAHAPRIRPRVAIPHAL